MEAEDKSRFTLDAGSSAQSTNSIQLHECMMIKSKLLRQELQMLLAPMASGAISSLFYFRATAPGTLESSDAATGIVSNPKASL